jgi:hypothetical protein
MSTGAKASHRCCQHYMGSAAMIYLELLTSGVMNDESRKLTLVKVICLPEVPSRFFFNKPEKIDSH